MFLWVSKKSLESDLKLISVYSLFSVKIAKPLFFQLKLTCFTKYCSENSSKISTTSFSLSKKSSRTNLSETMTVEIGVKFSSICQLVFCYARWRIWFSRQGEVIVFSVSLICVISNYLYHMQSSKLHFFSILITQSCSASLVLKKSQHLWLRELDVRIKSIIGASIDPCNRLRWVSPFYEKKNDFLKNQHSSYHLIYLLHFTERLWLERDVKFEVWSLKFT